MGVPLGFADEALGLLAAPSDPGIVPGALAGVGVAALDRIVLPSRVPAYVTDYLYEFN